MSKSKCSLVKFVAHFVFTVISKQLTKNTAILSLSLSLPFAHFFLSLGHCNHCHCPSCLCNFFHSLPDRIFNTAHKYNCHRHMHALTECSLSSSIILCTLCTVCVCVLGHMKGTKWARVKVHTQEKCKVSTRHFYSDHEKKRPNGSASLVREGKS